jgi:aminoglycoside phosphotransferase (APT) family kinase protein
MEHVEGLVADSLEVARRLTPEIRGAVGLGMPRALAEIHAVDLEGTGLSALSRSKTPYAERQLRRWRGQWEGARTRDLPLVDELAERLWAALPPQRETTIVHGDFHLLNAIVSPDDGAVRAVLDWELCTLGDPLADLGGLLAYWPDPGQEPGPLIHFSVLSGFPSGREIAEAYAAVTDRPLDTLGFWQALGIWKVAIIAEGVLRRAQEDRRNSGGRGAPAAAAIDRLLRRAADAAAAAGI